MAITIDGTNGLTTDNAALKLDGTTLVVDDTNNRVGIGTSSPSSKLHVVGSQFRLQTDNCSHQFYNTAGSRYAYLEAASGGVVLDVESGGGSKFIVRSSGSEKIQVNQYGLCFNGDTAAANALDDYEEGTYTPVITCDTGSITSYVSSGTYVKIGKIVQVAYKFALTNVGTASGKAHISMPFTAVNFIRPFVGVAREDQVVGTIYFSFGEANSTQSRLGTSTNGGIAWTNGYGYVGSCTYEVA